MTVALYTNIVSPHQLPLAREIAALVGEDNYRYVFSEEFHVDRAAMGWSPDAASWILSKREQPAQARKWLEECDVLICGARSLDLIEFRSRKGLKTFYANERWFKPFGFCHDRIQVPGRLRMIFPGYRRMASRFVDLARRYDNFRLLPFGVWARRDFNLMGVPESKMTTWGYFVAPGQYASSSAVRKLKPNLRILWVGRMLGWKRVDTILKALRLLMDVESVAEKRFSLTLVGNGPELFRLQRLARGLSVDFLPYVPIAQVRELMHRHNVYVLSSNGQEGWGAALNEALEEGLQCVGTFEAGASATMLPQSNLYHTGDTHALVVLLRKALAGTLPKPRIGEWTAKRAAENFIALCR